MIASLMVHVCIISLVLIRANSGDLNYETQDL
jgi:hypothetical protein